MSEEAKRMVSGAILSKSMADDRKPLSDDRKSLSGSGATAATGKKFIVKSADMKDDMQKEAIDIAISVTIFILIIFSSPLFFYYYFFFFQRMKLIFAKYVEKDFNFCFLQMGSCICVFYLSDYVLLFRRLRSTMWRRM